MRRLRVGLIGYGLAGSTFHAPVIAAVPSLSLTTVVTSRVAAVERDLPGVRIAATSEHLFTDPTIELIAIATPNDTHFELARRALRAGKHVVIDKPMTIASAEADALIALAAERQCILSVYQNRRWDGDFRTVAQCIADGSLGNVVIYEANYDRFRPAIKPGWREATGPGTGLLFDLGSHLIDQALHLFGMPETIVGDVFVQRAQAQVDDYFHLIFGYPGRRVILRAATLVREPGPHFAVHGTAGSFIKYGMDPQEAALKAGIAVGTPGWGEDEPAHYGTYAPAEGLCRKIPTLPGTYVEFYAAMAAAILDGTPPPVAARDARNVIRAIELARASAIERRTVATVR